MDEILFMALRHWRDYPMQLVLAHGVGVGEATVHDWDCLGGKHTGQKRKVHCEKETRAANQPKYQMAKKTSAVSLAHTSAV
jgi:hypothetical protein